MDKILTTALPAPAKLNMHLHVTGRRSDGYHFIDSKMVYTDLCDTVHLTPRTDGKINRLWHHDEVSDEDDLSCRAARLLAKYARQERPGRVAKKVGGVDIAIDKNIPIGSGMGGGSSNAATTLIGLNKMWHLDLTQNELLTLAQQLGADVAFFIFGKSAHVSGIGEVLSPFNYAVQHYLLALPPQAVQTAAVFNCLDNLTIGQRIYRIEPLHYEDNHLSPAAVMVAPNILATAKLLSRVAKRVRLSGSGAAVYANFASRALAERAKSALLALSAAVRVLVVSGMCEHPLYNYHWGVAKR